MKVLIFILPIFIALQVYTQTDTRQVLKRGIYVSHIDYLNNSPSIRDSFIIKSHERLQNAWKGDFAYMPKYYDTKRNVDDAWGFCDGNNQYIYFQGSFFRLERKNDTIGFYGYAIPNIEEANGNLVTGYFLGGVTGLLIAEVVNNSNKVKYKIPYVLDPHSGLITYKEPLPPHPRTRSKLYIYRSRKQKEEKDTLINLSVNDSLFYSLVSSSFVEMEFVVSDKDNKICYGTDYSKCIFVTRNNSKPRYVRVVYDKKTGDQYLEIVSKESEGDYQLSIAEHQQMKRERKENRKIEREQILDDDW